jgi:O-antigen/teichoic acid export membrane protein
VNIAERPSRIARNTLFNSATAAIGVTAGLATSIVIARELGPADTGIYVLAVWTTIVALSIVGKGFAFSIMKSVAQYDLVLRRNTIVGIVGFALRAQAALAVVGAAVVAACSGPLANLFDAPEAQPVFVLASLLVFTQALIDVSAAPITGLERQGLLVPLVAMHALALFAAAVIVLHGLDAEIGALIASQVIIGFATLTVYLVVLSRVVELRPRARIARERRRRINEYALAMSVTLTLGLVVWQRSEIFILGIFTESSEVAYYSIAYAMSEALQGVIPVAFLAALFPNISRAFADRDHRFAKSAYENSLRLTTMAVLPVAVAGCLLSPSAIAVLYGDDFSDAALPLSVLLFSAGAQRIAYGSSLLLLGQDRERHIMLFTGTWAALNVALALALIPTFGIEGATAANAATQFSAVVAAQFLVRRTTGFGFPGVGLMRIALANVPVFASVALVVALVESDVGTLVAGIVVALAAYGLGLWAAGALRPLERQYIAARLNHVRSLWRQ